MRRDTLLGWLPALIAATMLAGSGAEAAPTASMVALCSGGSAEMPGKPLQRDCEKACHAGCERRKRR